MNTAFHVFPWNKPFLPVFKNFVAEASGGKPGQALIITPHMRPARYLTNLYRRDKKARILPKMLAVNELASSWRGAIAPEPLYMANELDQVALLHECLKELDIRSPWTASLSAGMDELESFLPWGLRLAKILEDFAIEGRELKDFPDMSDELGKTPAAILSSLQEIGAIWERKLKERKWTTVGQDHKFAAAHADMIPDIFMPRPDRPVFIAGFYILTGTHNVLLKSLWEAGAHICLHTDPALLEGKEHWSCRHHGLWRKDWRAELELMGTDAQDTDRGEKKDYTFFAGHDLHSQLQEMGELLRKGSEEAGSTAIIPCQKGALTALLQHLPPVNVNVSMGYPMERSSLVRLFQSILQMFANSPEAGRWRSEDVLAVIRHPYIQRLKQIDEDKKLSYRSSLRKLEISLLKSGPFWRLEKEDSLGEAFIIFLNNLFGSIDNLDALGKAIEKFCQWLLQKGRDGWRWYNEMDMEVMHRLVHDVAPVLRNNLLARHSFSSKTLLNFFTKLLQEQNIPFQADPIEGLQVLGLLESRLLHFDRVIFLDATDEDLPGKAGQDPLLPDSLRSLVGLPDHRLMEASTAHNLFRLIEGAREAHFLWQEGEAGGEFYDSKKSRSRFVERLIWEREKETPDLLDARPGLVRRPQARLHVRNREIPSLERSPELETAVDNFWSQEISVTNIDEYLKCPMNFMLNMVMNLRGAYGPKSRNSLAGTFVHKILQDLYGKREDGELLEKMSPEQRAPLIQDAYDRVLREEMKLDRLIAIDDQEALSISVPKILERYFARGADRLRCLEVEKELQGEIDLGDRRIKLKGRIDRLDLGNDGLYVVDYKTEKKLPPHNAEFWDKEDFFASAAQACQSGDVQLLDQAFTQLRENVSSLQLPLYLLLLAGGGKEEYGAFPANAAWVPLRFSGRELPLLTSSLKGGTDPRLGHFIQSLSLIYHHMKHTRDFKIQDDKKCAYCDHSALCGA